MVDTTIWNRIVDNPDTPATLARMPLPHPPLDWRDSNDTYRGKVTLAFIIGADGGVVPGSVSVEESTEGRLSLWACSVATQLRFAPATVANKPVYVMKEQPLSYVFGERPAGGKKP